MIKDRSSISPRQNLADSTTMGSVISVLARKARYFNTSASRRSGCSVLSPPLARRRYASRYFSVNPSYGTLDDFPGVSHEAHERGLRASPKSCSPNFPRNAGCPARPSCPSFPIARLLTSGPIIPKSTQARIIFKRKSNSKPRTGLGTRGESVFLAPLLFSHRT